MDYSSASSYCKLNLLMIGKSVKHHAFKNVSIPSLLMLYKSQKNAWMDVKMFKDCFFTNFVSQAGKFLKKKQPALKNVFIIGNYPTHPDIEKLVSGNIKNMFLPDNSTSLL